MKAKKLEDRIEKWEGKSRKYEIPPSREATFNLTVKNTLKLLGDVNRGKLLDIGSGFGEIDIMIARRTDFDITGIDISDTAIKSAQNNIAQADLSDRIKIEEADVYNLKYPNESFDVIVSFGYVSAATYEGVQKEVARVLKPGGILICDFINPLSVYKFINIIRRIVTFKKIPYFVSLSGIKREFEKEGLIFEEQVLFNTYPPFKFVSDPNTFLRFEEGLGQKLKNLLGRVRLVKFRKK
jgi:SAM-dependent methyltransferase